MADRIPILILATSGDIAAVFSHSIEGRHYALEVISPHAARYPDLAKQYQVAIIDERAVPKGNYLGNKLREHNAQIEFLSVVDSGDDRRGVDALNHGAFDYQLWPPNEREFFERVSKCVKKARLLPPTDVRFGNYRLYRRLATGGMAELFLAEPFDRDRVRGSACVVVKRLLPHLAHREEFTTMLMDEARISSQLKHPNIV